MLLVSVVAYAEDLSKAGYKEVQDRPWQLSSMMRKHQGPIMDQAILRVLSKSEDGEGLMAPLMTYLEKRPERDRRKLVQGLSNASLSWGIRLTARLDGFGAIKTLGKHLNSKEPEVQQALLEALNSLPWDKEQEKVMIAISKKMGTLFEIEDWQRSRSVSDLLDRWHDLEFPVERLYETRLKGDSHEGRRDALQKLVRIRQLEAIPMVAACTKFSDLHSTISRQMPYLLGLEGRSEKEFDVLLKVILTLLNEENFELHHQVVSDLGRADPSSDIARILCGLLDLKYGEEVVHHTARLLQSFARDVDLQSLLEARSRSKEWSFRAAVILTLGYFDEEWCHDVILRSLKEKKEEVLIAACETISRLSGPGGKLREDYIEALLPKVQTRSVALALSAAHALGRLKEAKVLASLAPLLKKRKTALPALALAEDLVGSWGKDPVALAKEFQAKKGPLPVLQDVPAPRKNSNLVFYDLEAECPSVIFIIDTSGSMNENGRWKQAKDELYKSLFGLQMDTLVNLIDYNTKVRKWKSYPVRATWRNKLDFFNHVEKLRPRGKTNISDAIKTGLWQWQRDTIFFLTDGMPTEGVTNTRHIISEVADRNRGGDVRIFCVGLQVKEAHEFLATLSRENGGAFRMVD